MTGALAHVLYHSTATVVFGIEFSPPPQSDLPDYPTEQVGVLVHASEGVFAIPHGRADRRWKHRNTPVSTEDLLGWQASRPMPWVFLLGSLCLEYDRDPGHLRWGWSDGLDAFVRIVQRHLWFEEYWRREGEWPVEDAPHHLRADGRPHPVLDPSLREAS